VIGRNEGQRLLRCLRSVAGCRVVYVDSASTDGSVGSARAEGADVVELDMTRPFTAARARNEGFAQIKAKGVLPEFVQFIDGDCELSPGWFDAASAALRADPMIAIVCGRRRERFPGASVYNRICDIEWNTPVGVADACGGDFLVRAAVFDDIRGFDATVIAGEEPELCFRLRARGYSILRIDQEMTLHDAAMTRFGQWWRRTQRSGYAYALGYAMHGQSPERFRQRNVVSITAWGGGVPLGSLACLALGLPLAALMLALLMPVQVWRVQRSLPQSRVPDARDARAYAASCVFGKIPEFHGVLQCWRDLRAGQRRAIIEYK
jgi:GT2 family glycosyltransferase